MSEHDELHRWARGAFKPARVHGSVHAIRERAIARSQGSQLSATDVIVGLMAVGGGYLIGRYWKRTHVQPTAIKGDASSNAYLIGTHVLAAR